MVNWSSKLAGLRGKVGLPGCSYLANNQLLTAEAVGPNSPLKAIFPQAAANSYYRDLAFVGGMPTGFATALGDAILPALGAEGPVADYTGDPGDTTQVEAQHA